MTAAAPHAQTLFPAAGADTEPVGHLNLVFAEALRALRAAGQEDLACRLAARGWAALRHTHPLEARRLERLLHVLARPMSSNRKES